MTHSLSTPLVDTSESSAEACALPIKRRLDDGGPPEAFKHLRQRGVV